MGIVKSLPRSLDEALIAYEDDLDFRELLGRELARNWLAVERATQEMLNDMPEAERRVWLMERY